MTIHLVPTKIKVSLWVRTRSTAGWRNHGSVLYTSIVLLLYSVQTFYCTNTDMYSIVRALLYRTIQLVNFPHFHHLIIISNSSEFRHEDHKNVTLPVSIFLRLKKKPKIISPSKGITKAGSTSTRQPTTDVHCSQLQGWTRKTDLAIFNSRVTISNHCYICHKSIWRPSICWSRRWIRDSISWHPA